MICNHRQTSPLPPQLRIYIQLTIMNQIVNKNFSKIRGLIVVILTPIFLAGCSGYQYVASPRFVPLNEKKGDVNLNVSLTGVQLGYAFNNRFSVFATGFQRVPTQFRKKKWLVGTYSRSCESREVNLGLSYFVNKENLQYEILAGAGLGDMEFYSENGDVSELTMQAQKSNIFIQPNFTYKFKSPLRKHLALAIFTKFNSLYYHNISIRNSQGVSFSEISFRSPSRLDNGLSYFGNRSEVKLFFIEPGLLIKGGSQYVKGMAQISYVVNAGGPAMYYQPISISLGCSLNFNLLDIRKK
jgi:hypothetical protein